MNNKRGVTLTVLAVAIVIMVILASVVVVNVGDSVTDTRKTTFANDLKTVSDQVSVYYVQNDKIPTDDEPLSEKEVLNLAGQDNMNFLKEELRLNGDDNDNTDLGTFYKINLSKIDIENTNRGISQNGENDIYVVSYPSLNVYYLAGISADSTKYFSLSEKLTQNVKVEDEETINNINNVDVKTEVVSGVTVKKMIKTWTNNANVLIQANIANTEKLYLVINNEKRQIKTDVGNNNLSFSSLEDIKAGKTSLRADITDADIEYFNNLPQNDKKLYIVKEKDGKTTANVEVDFSNFENMPPNLAEVDYIENDNYNIIEFSAKDSISGLKNVYYEVVEKYDENANVINYFSDVESYDDAYIKTRGKKLDISSDGIYQIKLSKDVAKIQITAEDKAGNFSTIFAEISKDMYVTVLDKKRELKNLDLKLLFISKADLESVSIFLSSDGIDFEDEKKLDIEKLEDEYRYEANVSYEDIITTQDLYVKINMNDVNGKNYVRIINLEEM